MPEVRIAAERRTEFGKGASRRVRREGRVPAAIYERQQDPIHITLPAHELMLALKTPNVLLSLDIDGKEQLALPKQIQRHPVRRFLQHVDLIHVRRGEKVVVEIPIVTVGSIAPGGLLDHSLDSLAVEAEATHIPQQIELSVEGLQIGESILAGSVALPAGLALSTDPEAVVLHVMASPTAAQLEGVTPIEAEGEAAEAESES